MYIQIRQIKNGEAFRDPTTYNLDISLKKINTGNDDQRIYFIVLDNVKNTLK